MKNDLASCVLAIRGLAASDPTNTSDTFFTDAYLSCLTAIEELELAPGEALYDLAFANRVGVIDGRHPELEELALSRIAKALTPAGMLFVDGCDRPTAFAASPEWLLTKSRSSSVSDRLSDDDMAVVS